MAFDARWVMDRVASLEQLPSTVDYLDDGDREDAVRAALALYARDVPRAVVLDLAGDGATFDFALPASFTPGWSQVVGVEYPTGQRPAAILAADQWVLYADATTTKLRLHLLTPGANEHVRVSYTALPTLDGLDGATATTVPAWHVEGLAALAASRTLAQLAARFVHEQESTLGADGVDRQSKADLAARRSREYATFYRSCVADTSPPGPAGTVVSWHSHVAGGEPLTSARSAWRAW